MLISPQLNSDKTYYSQSSNNIDLFFNGDIVNVCVYISGALTGGNGNNTVILPGNAYFKRNVFAPCTILNSNWYPTGNNGYVTANKNTLNIRCKDSITSGVVIANFTVPANAVIFN